MDRWAALTGVPTGGSGVLAVEHEPDAGPRWAARLAVVPTSTAGSAAGDLTAWERLRAATLHHEARHRTFVAGRVAARRALAALPAPCGPSVEVLPEDLGRGIVPDCLGAPLTAEAALLPAVSISHDEEYALGLAFSRWLVAGVDVEAVVPASAAAIGRLLTAAEHDAVASCGVRPDVARTFAWTAKEALGKAIGTGFLADVRVFELGGLRLVPGPGGGAPEGGRAAGALRATFRYFPRMEAHGFRLGRHVVTLCLPRRGAVLLREATVAAGTAAAS